jgi:anti-sigma B factor antagonist
LADDKRFLRHQVSINNETRGERLIIMEEVIARVAGGVLVRFDGDITPACTADIEQFLDRLIGEGRCSLVIDLSSVPYVCSAGWGVFLGRVKDIRKAGGDIVFAGLRSEVMSVFDLLEANRIFEVFGGKEEAIRTLHSGHDRHNGRKGVSSGRHH